MPATPKRPVIQAFVELRAEDPEATSAFTVARERLAAGLALQGLRRMRLFEIAGSDLPASAVAERMHASSQFYNPVKERCVVRASASEAVPARDDEALVLVFERGGERRPGAERWWRHVGDEKVEVREGVVWALAFTPGADARALAEALAASGPGATGLLANVHVEEHRICAADRPPLDWITRGRAPRRGRRTT